MANLEGFARTNYVHVADLHGLQKALAPWSIGMKQAPPGTAEEGMFSFYGESPDGAGWPTSETDDDDNVRELDVAKDIMPHIREGEVLVLIEASHERLLYVGGSATAWIRRGAEVERVSLQTSDIYDMAKKRFGLSADAQISVAEY